LQPSSNKFSEWVGRGLTVVKIGTLLGRW